MRVVSFSESVPFEGIPHAGGEYVLRHVRALLEAGHRVDVVAPDTAENRAAAGRAVATSVVLVRRMSDHGPAAVLDRVLVRLRPLLPPRTYLRGVARRADVRALVTRADLLEFQWTEQGALRRRLERREDLPTVLVAHDVMTERFGRQAETATGVDRVRARFRAWSVERDERRILTGMGRVLTFSDKDVRHLERLGAAPGAVLRVDPPLEPADIGAAPADAGRGHLVLMVGAFHRRENADGARWFVDEVWPQVRAAVPDARVCFAGGGPDDVMTGWPTRGHGIEVTGYVEDLAPLYRAATVAVVPLLAGAGIKFKTITAMFWGLPVVATPIGAEGVGGAEPLFAAITANAAEFADAIVEMLLHPVRAAEVGAAGRRFAGSRYTASAFRARLQEIYSAMPGSVPAPAPARS